MVLDWSNGCETIGVSMVYGRGGIGPRSHETAGLSTTTGFPKEISSGV